MRKELLFNQNWLFVDRKVPISTEDDQFQPIDLPHSNKLFKHHNIDNQAYQFVSTYRKHFEIQKPGDGSRVVLQFDGVMLACEVFLNKVEVYQHKGGFIGFEIDLTNSILEGHNTLDVYVDSNERKDIPPFGHLVDYLTYGGIYRDVWLKILPYQHVRNVFVQPRQVLIDPFLEIKLELHTFEAGYQVRTRLLDAEFNLLVEKNTALANARQTVILKDLPAIHVWDVDDPYLYTLETILLVGEQEMDRVNSRFGFREAEFRKEGGFFLNGEHLKLTGLNRHQTYPYIGAAAPARLQRQDADTIKYELGCNVVRTSHYPQSPHFLNRCDEIGLLVFEEIAGWQHIGDEDWKQLVLDELQAMIERDYNHPSIILWGVRVNESPDDDTFYTRTNALAHQLDPVRQTGGVRCFLGSHFLEDVYTYNDFSNTVVEPPHKPYLITEYAGHMFPAKVWDGEDRLIEHALLHTKIQNLQRGHPDISGAIGWCAFDYGTHIEFGSGDRICYHGVMDIFRLPKWAAYFYQSQISPKDKPVLKAATHWTMGDRSGGGNNPLTVFSNCDEVEVIIGEINVGKFKPDAENYPHLQHPPFVIYGLNEFSAWGQRRFYDLRLVGYLNGKPVIEQNISSNKLPKKMLLKTSTAELLADGSDMAQISFFLTDEFDNPLPYARNIIHFELDGEGQIIGENPFPMMGGQGAVYVKAGKVPGVITITARTPELGEQKITLKVINAA